MSGFPKVQNGRVDPQLTNVLLAYVNRTMLADQILPTVPNLKDETGLIPEMGVSHLRQYETKRSLFDTGEHRIDYTISNDKTYRIDFYDLSVYVPDRLVTQLQKSFDARRDAQRTAIDALMLEREIALADLMTNTSVITNGVTFTASTDKYTDEVNSTPEVDFDTARDSVFQNTGSEANAVYMSREVMNTLRRHPWFLEIAYSSLNGTGNKTKALSPSAFIDTLKAWYEVDFVFIGRAIKVSSNEGQTVTKANVWNNDVVWFVRPKSPAIWEPSFGYSFQLAGQNRRTVIRRHPRDKGDDVEAMWAYQDKILDPNSGYIIKNAI